MLQDIRDRATGVFAYVILFLISIPFALWGIQSYFEGGGKNLAAEVNGQEIPVRVYQNAFQQQKQRLNQMFKGRIPEGLINDEMLKHQAIESLVLEKVLQQELNNSGYRIGDDVLLSAIQKMEVFQTNGHFDPALYDRLLNRQRISKTGFEQQMRDSLVHNQFQEGIMKSALVLREQVLDYQRLANQTRAFDYVVIKPEHFRDQAHPEEASIQEYYDAHKDEFETEERVRVSYIELKTSDVAASIPVTDDEAAQYYDEQKASYRTPERRKLRHILVKVEGQRSEQQAMERAQELLKQIKAGKDFTVVAQESSEETFTAKRGGDLGEVERGELGDAFDQVAFRLAPGELSDPVKTERGVELILVESITPSRQMSFPEVKDRVISELRQQEAERRYLDLSEKLATLSYEVPDNLEEAADAVGVKISTSDWFGRDKGEGIAMNPDVREAAFSQDVLNNQNNSDPIELGDGDVVVLRVLEHQTPQQRPLSEVHGLITNILATQDMQRMVRQAGRSQLEKLKSGQAWDTVVAGEAVKQASGVTRSDSSINPELLSFVFRMNHPKTAPVYSGLSLPDGSYAVVRLNKVTDGSQSGQAPASMASKEGQRAYEAVLNALKERAEIRIYNDNL
jgi:peptidyl-prolyl cis-trans isomerase D